MSLEGTFALQEAIKTALSTALAGAATVHDHVPQNTAFPYVVIGDTDVNDWGTKDSIGTEQLLLIEVWSRYKGRKQALSIGNTIYETLHEQGLAVDGQQLVLMRFDSADALQEADGETYRRVMRFRALLDQQD